MPKVDIARIRKRKGSRYPAAHAAPCSKRERTPLGNAAGLYDFGVNQLRLPPGAWSSQRHWHDSEDEFIYVLSGEVILVTESGETLMRPGDCAGFPKNLEDGHHLINRGKTDAIVLEVGSRVRKDVTTYPDIDMMYDPKAGGYVRKNGKPYPKRVR